MKQKRRVSLKEWFSIQLSKNPGGFVLFFIFLLNILFVVFSAGIISALSIRGTEQMNFGQAVFYTISMVLDAGCVSYVIEDVGQAGLALIISCLVIIVLGMILFTGAVIGYLTNYISGFIEHANLGTHDLYLSNHTVILGWNSRASEIVNDFLYCREKQKIVILVESGKEEIEREIDERISDTILRENKEIKRDAENLEGGWFAKRRFILKNRLKNNLILFVRTGDIFSTKQLNDISLKRAKSIIILNNDVQYMKQMNETAMERGSQSIKALVQVADITAAEDSLDDQKIVIEIEDVWTGDLVEKIIRNKQVEGKCKIRPLNINKVLGRLLSQFSIMPELNLAYKDLLSNKGMAFFPGEFVPQENVDEVYYTKKYLSEYKKSIPLSLMKMNGGFQFFYASDTEWEINHTNESSIIPSYQNIGIKVNHNYQINEKTIVVLGHNSKMKEIMDGFTEFCQEWDSNYTTVGVHIIDDAENIAKMNSYLDYPFVRTIMEANVYQKEKIMKEIEEIVDQHRGDTSILILSDDKVPFNQIDSTAIDYLIYVRDIVCKKKELDPNFDEGKMDIIVEIINPKHYDVVMNYSSTNVVISNRYISKMITQLASKELLYGFYKDILSYDMDLDSYESKEIYIKGVEKFFITIPPKCTAAQLIRDVYYDFVSEEYPKNVRYHTLILGYISHRDPYNPRFFYGDQNKMDVALEDGDKLIVYSTH